jgi:hypothetical protein
MKKNNIIHKPANHETLSISNISMKSETIGWILKGNKVLRTVDGGRTWNDIK